MLKYPIQDSCDMDPSALGRLCVKLGLLLLVVALHDVEGEFPLAGVGYKTLAVEPVLDIRQWTARREEVLEDPWRETREAVDLVHHL